MHPPMFVYVESFNAIDGRSITFLGSSQSFGNSGRRRLLMAESYLRLRKAGAGDATATHRRSAALGAVCHRRLPFTPSSYRSTMSRSRSGCFSGCFGSLVGLVAVLALCGAALLAAIAVFA